MHAQNMRKLLAMVAVATGAFVSAAPAQTTIFTDSFAASTLGSAWSKGGTANWRVQTSTTYRNGTTGFGVTKLVNETRSRAKVTRSPMRSMVTSVVLPDFSISR